MRKGSKSATLQIICRRIRYWAYSEKQHTERVIHLPPQTICKPPRFRCPGHSRQHVSSQTSSRSVRNYIVFDVFLGSAHPVIYIYILYWYGM